MCDFYDIHILWSEKADIINIDTLRRAIINVARKRGTIELFDNTDENLRDIVESDYLRDRNKRRLEAVRHSRVQRLCGNARRVQKNVEEMILKVKDNDKGIFICTPYYIEPNGEDMMRKRMDEYGAVCKKLAEKYGRKLIDFQALYNEFCKHKHSSIIAWGSPESDGATLMAKEFLSHCDFDFTR